MSYLAHLSGLPDEFAWTCMYIGNIIVCGIWFTLKKTNRFRTLVAYFGWIYCFWQIILVYFLIENRQTFALRSVGARDMSFNIYLMTFLVSFVNFVDFKITFLMLGFIMPSGVCFIAFALDKVI